ncbi:MAG: hypothetical protein H0T73_11195 [Ardenticatenales bacterium]|nr:hypothetical protein [Ardenticatenales bacterium]
MKNYLLILVLYLMTGCGQPAAQDATPAAPTAPRTLPATWTPAPSPTTLPTNTPEPTPTLSPDIAVIEGVFGAYRSALLAEDGEAARNLVGRQTIAWYEEVLAYALVLPREELERLPFLKRLTVLIMRHNIPQETLLTHTGESIFELAVNEGWIGRETVEQVRLAKVTVNGDVGLATSNQAPDGPPVVHFIRENGEWKLNLASMIVLQEQAFKQLLESEEMDESTTIIDMIHVTTGRPIDERILDGPLPASEFPP